MLTSSSRHLRRLTLRGLGGGGNRRGLDIVSRLADATGLLSLDIRETNIYSRVKGIVAFLGLCLGVRPSVVFLCVREVGSRGGRIVLLAVG